MKSGAAYYMARPDGGEAMPCKDEVSSKAWLPSRPFRPSGQRWPRRSGGCGRAIPAGPRRRNGNDLKAQVGGNLTQAHRSLFACAPRNADKQPIAPTALKEIGNPFFIGDQAGGTQVSGWLNAWSPKPSAYAVARTGPRMWWRR